MIQTKIMGILNTTPDSFYVGSRHEPLADACAYGKYLETLGADILDIGGESTRPGSQPVSIEEELNRVIPVIKELRKTLKIPISIDTMKPKVAAAAIEAGASLINDVGGFTSPEMREVAASFGVDVCAMHGAGSLPAPQKGVTQEILRWFETIVKILIKSGIKEERIILDPGIGFSGGNTVPANLEILNNLSQLLAFGFPLLLGISRKSFMSRILNLPPSDLLPATLAMNTLAIEAGVHYIRVHDVKEHKEAAVVVYELCQARNRPEIKGPK